MIIIESDIYVNSYYSIFNIILLDLKLLSIIVSILLLFASILSLLISNTILLWNGLRSICKSWSWHPN